MRFKTKLRVFTALLAVLLIAGLFPVRAAAIGTGTLYPEHNVSGKSGLRSLESVVDIDAFRAYLSGKFYLCENEIDITQFRIPYNSENVQAISRFIWKEMPEAFHVNGISTYYSNNTLIRLQVGYSYSAQTYQRMAGDMKNAADTLLRGIPGNTALSEAEKALLLHDRLAVWNEYDYANLLNGTVPRESYTAYGALVNRTSVCEGYTLAYMYLLNRIGIRNIYCASTALNHAWNIVYIDGIPYHTDVTWDDPVWDVGGRVYHRNFLISSEELYAQNHTANDYSREPQDKRYENAWWRASQTAVQLIGSRLYYIDNEKETLNEAENGTTRELLSVSAVWPAKNGYYWVGNFTRLSAGSNRLFYSTPTAVYEYDLIRGKTRTAFAPDLSAGNALSIYGFFCDDGCLVCETNDSPDFSETTKARGRVKRTYFPDLDDPASWYFEDCMYCADIGIFSGNGQGEFDAVRNITRAELATIIASYLYPGYDALPDADFEALIASVDPDPVRLTDIAGKWYERPARLVAAAGIVSGNDQRQFSGENTVTREQMAVMLCGAFSGAGLTFAAPVEFADADQVSGWAAAEVTWCGETGLFEGDSAHCFHPQNSATRAEVAVLFAKIDTAARDVEWIDPNAFGGE